MSAKEDFLNVVDICMCLEKSRRVFQKRKVTLLDIMVDFPQIFVCSCYYLCYGHQIQCHLKLLIEFDKKK
jgi:hypothetical protein